MRDYQDDCFGYERLEVWQKAVDFAGTVYGLTRPFPREEMFGLTSQLRRAGTSVACNIAEGASRFSGNDQGHFYEIAYGSLCEIATLLRIACGQRFVTADQVIAARSEIAPMCRMLSGLRRRALGRGKQPANSQH